MARNWWRKLFSKSSPVTRREKRKERDRRPRFGLALERLEERLAPASFAEAGGVITISLTSNNETLQISSNGANNYHMVTSDATNGFVTGGLVAPSSFSTSTGSTSGDLTVNPADTQIAVADGAFLGGHVIFNDSGANAYAQNFNINLSNVNANNVDFFGTSTFNASLFASTTRGSVIVNAGAILNLNGSGGFTTSTLQQTTTGISERIQIDGTINTSASETGLTISAFGANVPPGINESATGVVNTDAATSTTIQLSAAAGTINLNGGANDFAGPVTVTQSGGGSVTTLTFRNADAAATLPTLTGLGSLAKYTLVTDNTSIPLANGSNLPTGVTFSYTAGGDITQSAPLNFNSATLKALGSHNVVISNGITVTGTLSLVAGGSITGAGQITAPNLALQAAGAGTAVSLTNTANSVSTLAGSVSNGSFTFINDGSLTIAGPIGGVTGLTSVDRFISVTSRNGDVTVNGNVAAGSSSITLIAGFVSGGRTLTNNAAITATGNSIVLRADGIDLLPGSSVTATNGTVNIRANFVGQTLGLGSTAAGLNLSQAELDTITAGTLILTASQDISLDAPVTLTQVATLVLQASFNGAVVDNSATEPDITVTNLAIQTKNGAALETAVSQLAFSNSTSGAVTVHDAGSLTITSVGGLTTSSNAGTSTTVTADGDLTVSQALNGGTGPVTLTSGAANNGSTLTVGAAVTSAASVTLAGGTGADRFVIDPVGSSALTVTGGGNDTLDLSNFSTALSWNVTGADAGNVTGVASFTNIQNLIGGTGSDAFTLAAAGSLSGNVNGGTAGTDTLDNSAIGSATVMVTGSGSSHGARGTATGIGGTFDNIDSFTTGTANVVFNGAPLTNNSLRLFQAGGNFEYQLNGGTPVNLGASLNSFAFKGSGGQTNSFTLDYTGGVFIVPGGITFNGGALPDSPSNSLAILGGSFTTDTYTYTGAHNGTVTLAGAIGTQTINFTNLTPLTNTGTATDAIFNLPASANATLADGAAAGQLQLFSTNATFETTTFAAPSGSLTINTGSGASIVTVAVKDGTGNVLTHLASAVTVNAAAGNNELIVTDTGNTTGETVTITNSSIATSALAFTINYAQTGGTFANEIEYISSGTAAATLNVQSTLAGTQTALVTGTAANTVNVSSDAPTNNGNLSGIAGPVVLDALGNSNTLNISERGQTTTDTITVDPNGLGGNLIRGSLGWEVDFNGGANGGGVHLFLGSGNNIVNVLSSFRNATALEPVFINGRSGNDTFNVSSNAPTNTGDLSRLRAPVTINAGTGTSALNVSESGRGSADLVTITSSSISSTIVPFTINYSVAPGGSFSGIHFTTPGAGFSTVNVQSTLAGATTTVIGSNNFDTLQGPDANETWNITGTNSGNVAGLVNFTGINLLKGGTGSDNFVLAAAGNVSAVNGGTAGPDTLNNSAIGGSSVTIFGPGTNHGDSGSATGAGFDNIDSFITAGTVDADILASNVVSTLTLFSSGGQLMFDLDGVTRTLPSNLNSFTFDGAAASTVVLNIDYTIGGLFFIPGGIALNGTPQNSSVTLNIIGGAFTTDTYTYTGPHDGTITLAGSSGTETITFSGLTPLTNSGTAADIIFNLPAGAVDALLRDDGIPGNNMSQLFSPSGSFEVTTFTDPSNSLTVNAGGGTDTITTSADFSGDFTAGLTLNGTLATDTININGLTLSTGTASLAATGHVINVNADVIASGSVNLRSQLGFENTGRIITTTNGNINVTAGGTLIVDALISAGGTGAVTLTANGPTSDLFFDANVTSGSGTITATAGRNVTLFANNASLSTTGNVNLTATAGAVRELGTGIITAGGLLTTNSVNGTILTNANAVNRFNATNGAGANGIVLNDNVTTLTVTGASDTSGSQVTITNTGSITTTGAITTINGAIIRLHSTGTGDVTVGAAVTAGTSGNVFLTADNGNVVFNGGTAGSTSGNVIADASADINFTAGGINTGGNANLTAGGNITFAAGSVNAGNNATLSAINGSITETGAGGISAVVLQTISANGTVLQTGANTVQTFTATNSTSGNVALTNTAATLTIPSISESGGGSVIIANTGAIAITGPILAGTGDVTLTATSTITEAGGSVTGNLLTTSSAGGTTLNSGFNAVNAFNFTNTGGGDVSLRNGPALTITGGSQAGGGNVSITDNGAITITGAVAAGGGNVTLVAGGTLSEIGAGSITQTNLLTTNSVGGTTLNGANAIANFQAANFTSGDVSLVDNTALNVVGITNTVGNTSLTSAGAITETGTIFTNALTTSSAGGTTLNNNNSVNSFGATNTTSGNISFTNNKNLVLTGISNTVGNVNLNVNGSISEAGASIVQAIALTTSSVNGTTLTNANQVASFGATNTGTGDVSLVDVPSVTVTGITNLVGTVNVTDSTGGITTTGAVTGKGVNFTSANTISLGADVTAVSGGTVTLNPATFGANQTGGTLTAGKLLLTGTGSFLLPTTNINTLAANIAGFLALTDSSPLDVGTVNGVNGITDPGNDVNLTATGISLSQSINTGAAGNTTLNSSGTITETGSAIITTGLLSTISAGGTTLNNANNVSRFNATNSVSGNISLVNTPALTITGISNTPGTVFILDGAGITTTGAISATGVTLSANDTITLGADVTATGGGLVQLNTTANGVNQTAGAVTAGQLLLTGNGSFNLPNTAVTTLAANIQGSVTLNNTIALDINTVAGVNGIQTGGGNVVITAPTIVVDKAIGTTPGSGGTVNIGGGVTVNATLNAGAGNINLNAGTGTGPTSLCAPITASVIAVAVPDDLIICSTLTSTSGNITLTADSDNNGTGGVWIQTTGSVNSAANVTITGSALITATPAPNQQGDAIFVDAAPSPAVQAQGFIALNGNAVAPNAPIVINSGLTAFNGSTVFINSTGTITEGGAAVITTTGLLATTSVGGTTLNTANQVGSFNASNGGSGNISLVNVPALTITGISNPVGNAFVLDGAGITTTGLVTAQNVTLSANGTISLGANVTASAAAGIVTLNTTAGGATQTAGAITAPNLLLTGNGNFTLNQAGNTVNTLAANINGSLAFTDSVNLTVGTVSGTNGINAGNNNVTLTVAGTLGQTAAGVITSGLLTTSSIGGTNLGTAVNLVSSFNATNATSGDVILNDNQPVLRITGISNPVGNILVTNTGVIVVQGAVTSVVAGTITLNSTGAVGGIGLNGPITAANGNVNLTAANGPITAGAATGTVTANRLTTSSRGGTFLNFSRNTVNIFTASNQLGDILLSNSVPLTVLDVTDTSGNIGIDNVGAITIAGTVQTTGGGGITLLSTATISENATGRLIGSFLSTLSTGGTNLPNRPNSVGSFSAVNNGGDVTLLNTGGLLTITGINNVGNGVVTIDNTGGVTQTATGVVSAVNFRVVAGGPVTLDQANNQVNVFAAGNAAAGAPVKFMDTLPAGFIVGTVGTTSGITTSNGDVTLCDPTGGAVITISSPINTGDPTTGTATIRIASGGSVTQTAAGVLTAANLGVRATGVVQLATATNLIHGVLAIQDQTPGGTVDFSDGQSVSVSAISADPVCFAGASGVTTNGGAITLTIAGNLALLAPVSAGVNQSTVAITTSGGIAQNAAGPITANALGVRAGQDVTLNQATNLVNVFSATTGAGSVFFADTTSGNLTIGTVPAQGLFAGSTGVLVGGPTFALATVGGLQINNNVTVGNGTGFIGLAVAANQSAGVSINQAQIRASSTTLVMGSPGGSTDQSFVVNNPAGDIWLPTGTFVLFAQGGGVHSVSLLGGGSTAFAEQYYVGPGATEGTIAYAANGNSSAFGFHGVNLGILDTTTMGVQGVAATQASDNVTVQNDPFNATGNLDVAVSSAGTVFQPIFLANKVNVIVNTEPVPGGAGDTVAVNYSTASAGLQTVTVNGSAAADTMTVSNTPAGVTTILNGNGGGNNYTITSGGTLDGIKGPVNINGTPVQSIPETAQSCPAIPGGVVPVNFAGDMLTIDDSAEAAATTFTIAQTGNTPPGVPPTVITRTTTAGASQTITYTQLQHVTLTAGTNNDTVNVTPSTSTSYDLNGGGTNGALPGNVLNVNLFNPDGSPISDAQFIPGNDPNSGAFIFTNRSHQPICFQNFQTVPLVSNFVASVTPDPNTATGFDVQLVNAQVKVPFPNINVSIPSAFFLSPASASPSAPPGTVFAPRVAIGDVNGDNVNDLILSNGPGAASQPFVLIFDGRAIISGRNQGPIAQFLAYDANFSGGVNVAVGKLRGSADSRAQIITAPATGGGPNVKVFEYTGGTTPPGPGETLASRVTPLANFFAFDPGFTGGVNLASGDVNGDGRADIVAGAGFGGGPQVNIFSGADLSLIDSFFAFEPSYNGGVDVAAGRFSVGGAPADAFADVVAGRAIDNSEIRVFDGANLRIGNPLLLWDFPAFPPQATGATPVPNAGGLGGLSVVDLNGDNFLDLVVGAPTGYPAVVRIIDGLTLSTSGGVKTVQIPGSLVLPLAEYYADNLLQATSDPFGQNFLPNDAFHLVGGVLVSGSLPPNS